MYRIFICRGENNSAFAYSCESHNARFLVINDSHFCKKLDLDTNPFIQSLDQIALLYTAEDRYEAVRNLTTDQKALFHLYHVDQDDFEHLSRDFNVRNNTASKNPERVLPDRKKPLIVTNSHKRGRRPKTQQDNESSDDTKDHRLFEKQIEYFEEKCRVLVWDAPEHAASWPFSSSFDLRDKARWIDGILEQESIMCPIIVGQSMGGYVGQMYSELFPEKLKGFISIDSAPLQRVCYIG